MYEFNSRVRYSEIDHHGTLTLPALINYFQDCSTFQSEDVGLGTEVLKAEKRAWILSCRQVIAERYAALGERITIGTFPRVLEAFPVRRYHIDTNEHVNNCQYVQMALEFLPADRQFRQIRVEYKKSAVLGDVIYPKRSREEERTIIELCAENGRPYAVVEFK